MYARLQPLAIDRSPFSDPAPGAGLAPGRFSKPTGPVHFVEPKVVVEVEYRRWPSGGLIQQAAFKGIRTDKRPKSVVKEMV